MRYQRNAKHIISVSGGKDSMATRLVAIEKEIPHIAVFADTGNEHQITYDYLNYMEEMTGPIIRVKADYTAMVIKKRHTVETKWRKDGVSEEIIERALANLNPTGNPFLDLCLWKGKFPSTIFRFCSMYLKRDIIDDTITTPLLGKGNRVWSWQGVRADESKKRMSLPQIEKIADDFLVVRPILGWNVERVWKMHKRHNIKPNPLYKMGCARVGCMPCINAVKPELKIISERFPEVIERIKEWERLVGLVAKSSIPTFFAADKTPGHGDSRSTIDRVAKWAKTERGGRQYPMFPAEITECSSVYGLCE